MSVRGNFKQLLTELTTSDAKSHLTGVTQLEILLHGNPNPVVGRIIEVQDDYLLFKQDDLADKLIVIPIDFICLIRVDENFIR